MKKILLLITTLLLHKVSNAQRIKAFQCSITKTDSCVSVYSIKVGFDTHLTKERCLSLVKERLIKDFQVEINNIVNIEYSIGKLPRTFLYKIKIENVKGCSESDEKKK